MLLVIPQITLACEESIHRFFYVESFSSSSVNDPRIYTFSHPSADLLVAVHNTSDQSVTLHNDPWGRHIREYLFLETTLRDTEYNICLYADQAIQPNEISIEEIPHSGIDSNLLQGIQALDAMSIAWAGLDSSIQDQAIEQIANTLAFDIDDNQVENDVALYYGLANSKRFNYPEAKRLLEPLIRTEFLNANNSYIAIWGLGEIYLREGDANEAKRLLIRALARAEEVEKNIALDLRHDKSGILSDLGESYIALGEFEDGELALEQAIFFGATNPALLSHIHNNRAFLFIRKSRNPEIEQSTYQQMQSQITDAHYLARLYAIEAGDTEAQIKAENNQAVHFLKIGETRKALTHYLNALQLTTNDQFLEIKRAVSENIGRTYQSLGDYSKSLSYISESIEIAESTGSPQLSNSTCVLGTTLRLQGDTQTAQIQHSRCALLAIAQTNSELFIEAIRELSNDYLLLKHTNKAIYTSAAIRTLVNKNYQRSTWTAIKTHTTSALESIHLDDLSDIEQLIFSALELLNDSPSPTLALVAQQFEPALRNHEIELTEETRRELELAAAALSVLETTAFDITEEEMLRLEIQLARSLASKAPETALEVIENTLEKEYKAGTPIDEIESLRTASELATLNNRIELAKEYSYSAIRRIEELHEHLEAERLGPAWSDKTHVVFSSLVDLLLSSYLSTQDTSLLAEAFAVSERSRAISLRQRLGSELPFSANPIEEQSQIRAIASLANSRANTSTGTPLSDKNSESLLVKYNQQHDLLTLSRLANIDKLSLPIHLELSQVNQILSANQLVLNYISTENQYYLLVISASKTEVFSLGSKDKIVALANDLSNALRNKNSFPIEKTLLLSNLLLPNLDFQSEVQEILIVPDAGLHTTPFSSLSTNAQSYNPLIYDYTVTKVPSLSTLAIEKAPSHASRNSIAILADPVFNSESIISNSPIETDTRLRNWAEGRSRLVNTAKEAENLSNQFNDVEIFSFTREAANRDALTKDSTRNSKVLHIATHGYFKSTSDDNVGLALSPISDDGLVDPGFITLTELFGHSFNNELVVISGCDTSLGEENSGSGLNSLTRGFLAQGANSVISTIWPVEDRASAVFMSFFYKHLQEEQDVAKSLQLTQLDMFNSPEYRNPFYWGGYILSSVYANSSIKFDP